MEAIRETIREALREAIREAIREAMQAAIRELPGLITDVQKHLLEPSSRLNMLLYCPFVVLRSAHKVE